MQPKISIVAHEIKCEICKNKVPTITLEEHMFDHDIDVFDIISAWIYNRAKRLEILYGLRKSHKNNLQSMIDINARIQELETICG